MTYDEMANELNAVGWLVLPPEDAKQYQIEIKRLEGMAALLGGRVREQADEIEWLREQLGKAKCPPSGF